MLFISLYLITGVLAGILAGMLGVGGGLIIVPILSIIFVQQGIPHEHIMHLAIGTSLATIIPTAISSIRAHHAKGAIEWAVVRKITPGIVLGCATGSAIASSMDTNSLKWLVGLFQIYVGTQILSGSTPNPSRQLPGNTGITITGTVIGALSSMVGIGGGTLSVPFLMWCNRDVRQAIATSAAIGLPIAMAGSVGFALLGIGASNLPEDTLGFIMLPAFAGISLASVFFAPLGASLTHRLPVKTLKKVFAILLYCLAARMLLA